MKQWILSIILSSTLIASLVGCIPKNPDPTSDQQSNLQTASITEEAQEKNTTPDKLKRVQTIRLPMPYTVKTFDHAKVDNSYTLNILSHVYEGLMRLDQNHQPIPAMAQKVTVSPDQTVYTFTLRNAEWNDGKPVTAQDFAYAWKRVLAPETQSPYSYLLFPIVNAERYHKGEVEASQVGIRALDGYEQKLEVRLKRPVRNFLSLVALAPFLPERADLVQIQGKEYGKKTAGMTFNGPFVVHQVTEEGTVVLSKNKRYWDANSVHLAQVYFFVSDNGIRNINLYHANKMNVTHVEEDFAQAYRNSEEFHLAPMATTQYIHFNYKNPFLQNKKIRQAISYAIDRNLIVARLKNGGQPAGGLIPPIIKGVKTSFRKEANLPAPKQDVEKAKRLFKEGLTEQGLRKPPSELILLNSHENKNSGTKKKNNTK